MLCKTYKSFSFLFRVHFLIFFFFFLDFSRRRGLAVLIKRFLFALRRRFRSLFSLYFPAKVNFFPVLFLWFVDTAGKVNMYGESGGRGPTNLRQGLRQLGGSAGSCSTNASLRLPPSRDGMWCCGPWTCGLLLRTDVCWTDCYRTVGRSKTQVGLVDISFYL